ncbi:large conductance mechanosensitive channel [Breznakia sp. PF5-3]|uniref:large-conductance mechanosensitive channel protein MscL n=1 Tax=unclassified Breznakia TaxID=2623764 RepID=UPI00240491DF|nr:MULTISPECIES: large-conductance mechanosensitive channel protein MscL [unclassified Breznakia]MDF9824937.1 large conductance mechanosensitive channel [Breznakia sp. PM6-1]MDF9835795.1 large conductance mechanosensitive channel [Breznakia sp. PF5-3]MDF9837911.1 large conductance mechanosensitive channel [Breznakia sp. PFB2-8]MDF9859900.1 large conductance mechanosensitive channel [Breznakia sp. PH5-24]
MKRFIEEFKEFALKGNVLDMAIGVVIGGAFGKIVTSLVSDIITPLISMLLDTGEMADWTLVLGSGSGGEDVVLRYGVFLQNIIDFLLITFSIFVALRIILRFKRKNKEEVVEEKPQKSEETVLLEEIRDLLKDK